MATILSHERNNAGHRHWDKFVIRFEKYGDAWSGGLPDHLRKIFVACQEGEIRVYTGSITTSDQSGSPMTQGQESEFGFGDIIRVSSISPTAQAYVHIETTHGGIINIEPA